MKKLKIARAGWFLGLLTLLVGAQSSFALKCEGKIYFQPLKSWTQAYIYASGQHIPGKATDGWFVFDAASVGGVGNSETFFIFNNTGKDYPVTWFTRTSTSSEQKNDASMFSCSDFKGGETLYIYPNPADTSKTAISVDPPNAKRLHVLLPGDDVEWMAANPLISFDGTYKNSKPLAADPDNCGWYTYTWFNQEVTDNVLFIRDDDTKVEHAVGADGLNAETATPIVLSTWFDVLETSDLYFVLDDGVWDDFDLRTTNGFSSKPDSTLEGSCEYKLAAIIYDSDASLHPAFSCFTGDGNTYAENCQNGAQNVSATDAQKAIQACIGVRQGLVEETLGSDNKPVLSKTGEKCFISKDLFNQLFNYTKGVNEMSCFDMPFKRSSDGKWEFDSDNFQSAGAPVKGGFYPVENSTNESVLLAKPDQTPVPAARTKYTAEGPVYYCPELRAYDETENMPVMDLACNGPGWSGGHDCEGVFGNGNETDAFFGKYYKSSDPNSQQFQVFGWSCANKAPNGWTYYKQGTETVVADQAAQGADSRWKSVGSDDAGKAGRNQQFCFESHANFVYKPGLRFNFRGDDDIWVFIDKKLAVDLGGTHLAAPGYVDLDNFKGKSGELKSGNTYDLDIFFCDRRTTMSNVRIKTNMYIKQSVDLEPKTVSKSNGESTFELCYEQKGDGSCTSKILGGGSDTKTSGKKCGDELVAEGKQIDYYVISNSTQKRVIDVDELATADVHCGGINLTNRAKPVISEGMMRGCSLKPGSYTLLAEIDGKTSTKAMKFRVKGNVDVVTRSAEVIDSVTQAAIANYDYQKQAMAVSPKEDGSYDKSQLVPLLITSYSDPCDGVTGACDKPLQIDAAAAGSAYTLALSDAATGAAMLDVVVFKADASGKLVSVPFDKGTSTISGTVGKSGIDTLYVGMPFDAMEKAEVKMAAKMGARSTAYVTFFVPKLVFVDSDSTVKVIAGDPLVADSIRWVGSAYELYVMALNADNSPCGELCNFKLTVSSIAEKTSPGVEALSGLEVVNGRATVVIRSSVEYVQCENPACRGVASFTLLGPAPALMSATYSPMQFQNPPVPVPVLADIFDVHGSQSNLEMNIPAPYFSADQEYLDGIGDSLVVYYHRSFYNHKDSLPNKLEVSWGSDTTIVLDKEAIWAGRACGVENGAKDSTECLPRLTFGGVKFSKDVKTGGVGSLKSWATYYARGDTMTSDFPGQIQDRIAPVILSAKVTTDTSDAELSKRKAMLSVKFSEAVKKTDFAKDVGDDVFTFFLNSENPASFHEGLTSGPLDLGNASDSTVSATIVYSMDKSFPQSGDYIRFGGKGEKGYIEDRSDYDNDTSYASIRGADAYSINWNAATAYNAEKRLPSPWALITGDVSSYATRLAENGVTGIPADKASEWADKAKKGEINPVDIFAVDGFKDEGTVFGEIKNGVGQFAGYGFTPHGWFVKSDMGSLIESKEAYVNVNKDDVYFQYEVQYFTNLGNYVGSDKGKIYCTDKMNEEKLGKKYFNGGNCVDNHRNFVIVWNMLTDKNRLVGTGAYISKLTSFVKLGEHGKKNKTERTQMWGVRRGAKGAVVNP